MNQPKVVDDLISESFLNEYESQLQVIKYKDSSNVEINKEYVLYYKDFTFEESLPWLTDNQGNPLNYSQSISILPKYALQNFFVYPYGDNTQKSNFKLDL